MKAVFLLLLLGQKFYSDDPIKDDHDNLPIDPPATIELSATYDLLSNTFAAPELEQPIPRAMNVNTLGEVPNSSWFTNRIGVRDMSLEELTKGPGSGGPPDVSRALTIVSAKQGGITPGFTMRDSRGNVYFVKFDPKAYPSLSTDGQTSQRNTQTVTRWLIHLAVYQGNLAEYVGIFHLVVKVITFTGTLTHTGEYREA